jgi:hypothetical protein
MLAHQIKVWQTILFDTRSRHGMVGFALARLVWVALQTCLKCYTFGTKKMKTTLSKY